MCADLFVNMNMVDLFLLIYDDVLIWSVEFCCIVYDWIVCGWMYGTCE